MYTIGPNILEWLTETPFQFIGIKINHLVLAFVLLGLGYIALKWRAYTNLKQARTIIREFVEKLRSIEPTEDLRTEVKDYFRQEISQSGTTVLEAPPNMQILLGHAWQEFSEGIQVYPLGSTQLVNTYQAEDFFTSNTLVKPFALPLSHVSGIYTSTGLLFTFIALGSGMSSLIYKAAGSPIEGLKPFINGLSGKFVTSIIGLVVALLVDRLIRKDEHAMEEDLADIIYQLNRRVQRLTSQSILTEMNASIKAIPENIEKLLNKSHQDGGMMTQLKETIESSLKGVIEEHVTQIREDLKGISANLSGFGEDGAAQLTEVMKSLGPELKEAISSGVSGDISQLTETLKRLPDVMEASQASMDKMQHNISEAQAMMLQSVKDLLTSVSSESRGSLEEVLRILSDNSIKFQEQMLTYQEQQQQKNRESVKALTDMLEALKGRQLEQSTQLDASMASVLERLEQNFSQAQLRTNDAFTTLQASNSQLLEQMQKTMSEVGTETKQQLQHQQELTSQTLDTQRESVDNQLVALHSSMLETQREAQEGMAQGVQQLFETQHAVLTPLLNELQKSFKGFEQMGETLPNRVRETEMAIQSALGQLRTFMLEQMEPFILQASQLTQEQQKLNLGNESQFGQLQSLQRTLMESQGTLGKLVNDLGSLHTAIIHNTLETNGTLSRNGELIAGCIQKLNDTRNTLDNEYERLHRLSKEIANAYVSSGQGMTDAIEKMQINTQGFYGELGAETSKLTSHLQTAIHNLGGAINQFEEALEEKVGRH